MGTLMDIEETQEPETIDIDSTTVVGSPQQLDEPDSTSTTEEDKQTDEVADGTPDEPEAAFDLDLDGLEELDALGSDTNSKPKPLEFIEKLDDAGKAAYQKQLEDLAKPLNLNREYRQIAGTDHPDEVKQILTVGKNFTEFTLGLQNEATQVQSVEHFLDKIEETTGKTLEELLPERFGIEDTAELTQRKLLAENERLRTEAETLKKVTEFKTTKGVEVAKTFKAKSGGFELDMDALAPLLIKNVPILTAIRQIPAQAAAWEKHLIEVGKRQGMKEAKVNSTPDIPNSKQGGESAEIIKAGPFAGIKKPKAIQLS